MMGRNLLVFKGIQTDPVIMRMFELAAASGTEQETAAVELASLLVDRAERFGLTGRVLEEWIWHCLLGDVNAFSLYTENGGASGEESSLFHAVVRDLETLRGTFLSAAEAMKAAGLEEYALRYVGGVPREDERPLPTQRAARLKSLCADPSLTDGSGMAAALRLAEEYRAYGCGILAQYPMFRWTGTSFAGIDHYDTIRMDDLVGYTYQKESLIANTESFLRGNEANNVLLAGAAGTGKSSMIKALANEYFDRGLRLLEVGKDQLPQLPAMLAAAAARGKRFIFFIDDLSFEDFEVDYKYIKSLLEGSVEKKPGNVLFYATSNRRHIIQQKWKDRHAEQYDQEVHGLEAMNEKLSLSQRFGLTLTFPAPSQKEYLAIVHHMAEQAGIPMDDPVEFDKAAVRWSMEQKGFSGRTARQFILHCQQNQDAKNS